MSDAPRPKKQPQPKRRPPMVHRQPVVTVVTIPPLGELAMEMNLDDEVLDLIDRDGDIEAVLARLEESRPAAFETHRVALRYIVTSNSRDVALLDSARRRAVLDFIDRVHEKTRGQFLQCAGCGNPVPVRGGSLSHEAVEETMSRHLGAGCV